jgi:peptidoglycan-associated lipoprotein
MGFNTRRWTVIHGRKLIIYILAAMLLFAVPFFAGCAGCQQTDTQQEEEVATQEDTMEEETKVEDMEPPKEEEMEEKMEEAKEEVQAIDPSEFIDVFYAYDKAELTSESRDKLENNADLLKAFPMAKIVIEGHCDERGTNEYNLGLGERRAAAAKDYLVSLGIDAGRIDTISYGEEKPFAKGSTESAWKQNRRAHFALK